MLIFCSLVFALICFFSIFFAHNKSTQLIGFAMSALFLLLFSCMIFKNHEQLKLITFFITIFSVSAFIALTNIKEEDSGITIKNYFFLLVFFLIAFPTILLASNDVAKLSSKTQNLALSTESSIKTELKLSKKEVTTKLSYLALVITAISLNLVILRKRNDDL